MERLKSKALTTGHMKLCQAIETRKSTAQNIFYHSSCKSMLESASVSIIVAAKPPTTWHHTRDLNAIVLQEIFNFIEDNVVQKRQCYFLTFILTLYINRMKEEWKEREVVSESDEIRSHRLEEIVTNHFGNKINIISIDKKIIKPHDGVILTTDLERLEKRDIVERAALILREEIRSITCKKLPDNLLTHDLIAGECEEIPRILQDFYVSLLSGSSYRRKRSSICHRLAKSFCQDMIYNVTTGQIKPSKHITLGLA